MWVAGIGTASTAKAASVLAVASRVFAKWDAAFAARLREGQPGRLGVFWKSTLSACSSTARAANKRCGTTAMSTREGGARFIAAVEIWRSFRLPAALASVQTLLKDPETIRPKNSSTAPGPTSAVGA